MKNRHIILEDTTLRDGEQTPGVFLNRSEKMSIFNALVNAGVRWIEAGIPAMGGEELAFLTEVAQRNDEVNVVGWNRGVFEDVKQTIDLGFKFIHIGLPTSAIHLQSSINKSREWVLKTAADLVKYAKDRGVFVSISAEDVGRTEDSFLLEYAGIVHQSGADRIRLSDTVGILLPEQYGAKVKLIVENLSLPVQCHTHNDFGLALANLIAGLKEGATYFHVTVNGIGERAGMTDLAQAVMVLKKLYMIDLGIDTTKLTSLAKLVETLTNHSSPPWQPITGENVFAHESGIHVKGMLKNASTFEPLSPEEVGNKRKYVLGKHSGKAIIVHLLEELKVGYDETLLPECLIKVREQAIKGKKALTADDLIAIYNQIR